MLEVEPTNQRGSIAIISGHSLEAVNLCHQYLKNEARHGYD